MKKLCKLVVVICLAVCSCFPFVGCGNDNIFVVGAKDYTEQIILGNMFAELIRANTDYKVSLKSDMGSSVVFQAIKRGDVSMYVDYTGTLYATVLNHEEIKSPQEVYDITKEEMQDEHDLEIMEPLGFNNTYTLSVRQDTAEYYNLKTYSDLAEISSNLVFGGTFEILNRPDGIPGLKQVYGMQFKSEVALDGSLRYAAIANDEIQITDAFSTDGLLKQYELTVLEDDLSFFPPYWAVPVIRPQALEKFPKAKDAIDLLIGKLNEQVMIDLNYQVDVEKKTPKAVATAFLEDAGLI